MPRTSTMSRTRICRCPARCRRCICGIPIPACTCRSSRQGGRSAPIAGRSTRSNPERSDGLFGAAGTIGLVGLFLDDSRAKREIHALLDDCALVVVHVDRAGQLDEVAVEHLLGFFLADPILDIPQALVDIVQRALVSGYVARRAPAVAPGFLQQPEF